MAFNILNLRYFSKKAYSSLLEKVPFAFLVISGVILVLDLIGILLMFEKVDESLDDLSQEHTVGLIQNTDSFKQELVETNSNLIEKCDSFVTLISYFLMLILLKVY